MAQAFPRYCPRCGTPTRAKMRLCPSCGLSTTAMLRRPHYTPSDKNGEPQVSLPEQACVAPSPAPIQYESQLSRSPLPPTLSEPQRSPEPPVPSNPPRSPMPPAQPWMVPPDPQHVPVQPPLPHEIQHAPLPPTSPEPQRSPLPPRQSTPEESLRSSLVSSAHPFPPSPAWDAPGQPGTPAEQEITSDTRRQPQPAMMPGHGPQRQAWRISRVAPAGVNQASSAQGKRRTAIVLILLALLLILGTGVYLAITMPGGRLRGLVTSQASIRTVNLHIPVTYAGISLTLLNVQQAQNFVDDPQSTDDGMVRLHLQERNTTTTSITWNYADSARLLVRGRVAAAPVYVQSTGKIAPGAAQSSVLDFAMPRGIDLSTASLQLGTSSEAQMRIPLAGQTNLSQYQAQTRQQHGNTDYFGLSWTLTSTTTSLSVPGQQADRGMEYLTLSLTVDNTLMQQVISGSPFEYARVKINGKTFAPVSTTLPVSFASGATGKRGTLTFLIPQDSASGTFFFVSQNSSADGPPSIDFSLVQNPGGSGQVSGSHRARLISLATAH